jgi:hypothetical protein
LLHVFLVNQHILLRCVASFRNNANSFFLPISPSRPVSAYENIFKEEGLRNINVVETASGILHRRDKFISKLDRDWPATQLGNAD